MPNRKTTPLPFAARRRKQERFFNPEQAAQMQVADGLRLRKALASHRVGEKTELMGNSKRNPL